MTKWIQPTAEEAEQMRVADAAATRARAQQEQRRTAIRLGLHANVTAESETNFFTGFTENISEGGVFISTFSPPPVGAEVALRITIRGSSELVVKGIVRWHRSEANGDTAGCGVQFTQINERQDQVLQAMLEQAAREPLLFES